MKRIRLDPLWTFITIVCLIGLVALVRAASTVSLGDLYMLETFLLLAALTVLGEVHPVVVQRNDQESAITISTTFSFALLLTFGPFYAIAAQGIASIVDDTFHRKPAWKALFNVAQYSISLGSAGLALQLLGPTAPGGGFPSFAVENLPSVAVAAATFFAVNHMLIAIAVTVAQRIPLRTYFRQGELVFAGTVDAMLMSLSLIFAVALEHSLVLIPILTLPLVAIYKSTRSTLDTARWAERLHKQAEENQHQATHDSLTGLPNRVLFQQKLRSSIADPNHGSLAVMIMDLDGFKEINDALGHHSGDALLTKLGERLASVMRQNDLVARLGGDEFGILVSDVSDIRDVSAVAERIIEQLERPFPTSGIGLNVGASIGIALAPEQGNSDDVLMRHADVAMYHAKSIGSGYEFYSPEHDHHSPARLALVDELRKAIENDRLSIHYQPKIDLESQRVSGVEALVRWKHPRRGYVSPGEFIPLAEQAGLIGALSTWVFERSIQEISDLEGGDNLTLAVNLSVQSLLDADLVRQIDNCLRVNDFSPARLILEITESCMMSDPVRTKETLDRLSDIGVSISVDDFGTGYSSLAYLQTLPVSEIKVDRSFVLKMMSDAGSAVIVKSIIDLGRNLSLRSVAEGVEDAATLRYLQSLGCETAQGFHMARPMPVSDLGRFLSSLDASFCAGWFRTEAPAAPNVDHPALTLIAGASG
jgi:diguanylate cyclase (GGDEF)-like protein